MFSLMTCCFRYAAIPQGPMYGRIGTPSNLPLYSGGILGADAGRMRGFKLASSAITNSVPCGGERREWRHVSAESGCNFLENDRVVGWQCSGKSRSTGQNRLGRTSSKGWANPRHSATLRPVRASADVWDSQLQC